MRYFSGLIPADQQVLHPKPYPYVYRGASLRRQRSTRKGLLACLLLMFAFFLLLCGGSMMIPGPSTTGSSMEGDVLEDAPVAMIAAMAGYRPLEAMQLLWDNGIDIVDAEQTLKETAEGNGRKSSEILAILQADGLLKNQNPRSRDS